LEKSSEEVASELITLVALECQECSSVFVVVVKVCLLRISVFLVLAQLIWSWCVHLNTINLDKLTSHGSKILLFVEFNLSERLK